MSDFTQAPAAITDYYVRIISTYDRLSEFRICVRETQSGDSWTVVWQNGRKDRWLYKDHKWQITMSK